jgi:hypothetical protein
MRTWDAPDFYRPIAAPLERCAELLGVDLGHHPPSTDPRPPTREHYPAMLDDLRDHNLSLSSALSLLLELKGP